MSTDLVRVNVEGWTLFRQGADHLVRDLDLAEQAGLAKPRDIRTTIAAATGDGLFTILTAGDDGPRPPAFALAVPETVAIGSGAKREVTAYYLNREAALHVVMRLRTPRAVELQVAIVRVFLRAIEGPADVRPTVGRTSNVSLDDLAAVPARLATLEGIVVQLASLTEGLAKALPVPAETARALAQLAERDAEREKVDEIVDYLHKAGGRDYRSSIIAAVPGAGPVIETLLARGRLVRGSQFDPSVFLAEYGRQRIRPVRVVEPSADVALLAQRVADLEAERARVANPPEPPPIVEPETSADPPPAPEPASMIPPIGPEGLPVFYIKRATMHLAAEGAVQLLQLASRDLKEPFYVTTKGRLCRLSGDIGTALLPVRPVSVKVILEARAKWKRIARDGKAYPILVPPAVMSAVMARAAEWAPPLPERPGIGRPEVIHRRN